MSDTGLRAMVRPVQWEGPPVAEQVATGDQFMLPVGTVTLLLGDVEGSTRLWQADPTSMAPAMGVLDEAVNEAIGRHEGVRPIEQGEGDSFVAAFARASDAAAAAVDIQRWVSGTVRLRLGLHTGEVQLRSEGNYIGLAINRCARLRDLGHGGQILLSQTTSDLVQDELPDECWLLDVGVHRLRDLSRPEHVWQLCAPGLEAEFPVLRSLDTRPHNLPVELTTFVGRTTELSELRELLDQSRLLTLSGSGGCGKTRLALQTAAAVMERFPDGTWFVELAPVSDPDDVVGAVCHALGVRELTTPTPLDALLGHLADRHLLLVLDNCEHVVDPCADLCERLVRACPGVTILVTSREPIGAAAEVVWRVPSLTVPSTEQVPPITALSRSESVQLFVERARRVKPQFELTDANAEAIADICRRLDGIPLAIELAASRAKVFSPQQIADRLHDRFQLLTGGARTSVPRQQTLLASIEWSHHLLTEPEQVLFRRLGVFPASFDFDAVEVVGASEPIEAHQVLDLLSLLVDKSLVTTIDTDGGTRYRLLETVRDYALGQLETSGEADAVRRRHRDHYCLLALHTISALAASDPTWVRQVEEIDNERAAFQFSQARGDTSEALAIATWMFPTWINRGRGREGWSWIEEALDSAGAVDPHLRALALSFSAQLAHDSGRDGRQRADEAIQLAREIGDDLLLSRAVGSAGWAHVFAMSEQAIPLFREAIELAGSNAGAREYVLFGLGVALRARGDLTSARPILEEAHQLESTLGVGDQVAVTLAELVLDQGELDTALSLSQELAARTPDPQVECRALTCAAMAAAHAGDVQTAHTMAQRALERARRTSNHEAERGARCASGHASLAAGDATRAIEAFQGAERLFGVGALAGVGATIGGIARYDLEREDHDDALRRATQLDQYTSQQGVGRHFVSSIIRARVALHSHEPRVAEDHGHAALQTSSAMGARIGVAESLEVMAAAAQQMDSHHEAVRLLAAADSIRRACRSVRYQIDSRWYESLLTTARASLGDQFDTPWSEGAAMTQDEAVTYAARGRGERKRPATGWDSLTPAEQNLARLVGDGLDNDEIAGRLFISERTVQSHLTRIYAKLGTRSRVRVATEASQHR